MPVIQCDIREGRTAEQKAAMAEAITRAVHETIGAPIEYIYVLIRETASSGHQSRSTSSATIASTRGASPRPTCVSLTSTWRTSGDHLSMQARHATIPSRLE